MSNSKDWVALLVKLSGIKQGQVLTSEYIWETGQWVGEELHV
jgi:hypothetical protein